MTDDVTPIRQQYLEIKRQYPDTLLLFRLGDFYETFDQDAEIASRELDIVLTSRPIGKGLRAPLGRYPLSRHRELPGTSHRKRLPCCHLRTGRRPARQGHISPQSGPGGNTGNHHRSQACFPVIPTTILLRSFWRMAGPVSPM